MRPASIYGSRSFRVGAWAVVAFAMAGCGGGGGGSPSAPPVLAAATTAPVAPGPPTAAPASVPLVVSTFAPTSTVDASDAHPVTLAMSSNGAAAVASAVRGAAHLTPPYTGGTPPPAVTISADRRSTRTTIRRPLTNYVGYPDDLRYAIYSGTHVVVGGAASHVIYVNCITCWGAISPGSFLSDFTSSSFIAVLNQYIGLTQTGRYTKGTALAASMNYVSNGTHNPVLGESDLLLLVYAAASQLGAGYGHIYHILLPPNVDTCFDLQASCYSPDHTASFTFCAYHSSVNFTGLGHVLYTVDPYDDVPGCRITNGANALSGGNDPVDSQSSLLLHELAETITDPDPDSAWVSPAAGEIGDICQPFWTAITMGSATFTTQFLYSNARHACVNGYF